MTEGHFFLSGFICLGRAFMTSSEGLSGRKERDRENEAEVGEEQIEEERKLTRNAMIKDEKENERERDNKEIDTKRGN